jgi:hypothetical protein
MVAEEGRVVVGGWQVEMEMKRQAKLRQLTDDVSSDVMHRPTLNALSVGAQSRSSIRTAPPARLSSAMSDGAW